MQVCCGGSDRIARRPEAPQLRILGLLHLRGASRFGPNGLKLEKKNTHDLV